MFVCVDLQVDRTADVRPMGKSLVGRMCIHTENKLNILYVLTAPLQHYMHVHSINDVDRGR